MKKVLLLLTEAFPLTKNAEAFLEPEVEIAASYFDEIYICPASRVEQSGQDRTLAQRNIAVRPVCRESWPLECLKSIPYIVTHPGFWQDVGMLARKGLGFRLGSWKKLVFTLLTETAIRRHFRNNPLKLQQGDRIVIYSYWLFGEAGGAIALKKLFQKNSAVAIARGHGTDIVGYPQLKGYSPLKKYHLDGLDGIYPVSKKGKIMLLEQYKKYGRMSKEIEEKVAPIYLGIEDRGIRKKHPSPNFEIFTIVSCSSVIPVKRVQLIVQALALIPSRKISWIHLGEGELLEETKKQSHEMLGDNIRFEFKGSLSRKTVLDFYQTHDIHLFLNVSSSEGVPVSMMEAFSFGIPVIATDVGGVSELCLEGVNGFLLPKEFKPEELAELIHKVISLAEEDYEGYLQLRRSARNTILSDFTTENHKALYEGLLKKVYGETDDKPG